MFLYQLCIVDDHPIVCEAISSLFAQAEQFKPCLKTHSVAGAIQIAQEHVIDVMLVDIHLPDGSGFSLSQQLKVNYPDLKVILISALHEQLAAGWSLQCGADGMVCKDAEPQTIIDVVDRALRGEPAFQPRAYRWLMNHLRGELSEGLSQLSPREFIVFSRIGRGCNSKEISAELEISPRTVETYHRKIREKLCIPHHDALVRAATLLFGHGGGHLQIDQEATMLSDFESATLSEDQWDHHAHLTVAFLYLSRFSYDRGSKLIAAGIKRLNMAHNKPEAYHETITVAYSRLIKAALIKQPVWLTAQDFINAHDDLLCLDQPLHGLYEYYQADTLNSPEARVKFVSPDKKPLPTI